MDRRSAKREALGFSVLGAALAVVPVVWIVLGIGV
jgi:hypothetical protein